MTSRGGFVQRRCELLLLASGRVEQGNAEVHDARARFDTLMDGGRQLMRRGGRCPPVRGCFRKDRPDEQGAVGTNGGRGRSSGTDEHRCREGAVQTGRALDARTTGRGIAHLNDARAGQRSDGDCDGAVDERERDVGSPA
jgi:hypothetical protein